MLCEQSNTCVEAPSTIEILCPHVVLVPMRRSIAVNLTLESQEASTEHVQLEDPANIAVGYPEFHRNTLLSFVFRLVRMDLHLDLSLEIFIW